jgi:hypothetical protein
MRGPGGRRARHRGALRAVAACLPLACAAASSSGGQSVDRLAPAPYGDLETLVRDLFIPGPDSNGYAPPSAAELTAFEDVVGMIEARAFDDARERASTLGYDVWHLADPAAPELVALVERAAGLRGGGTYVVDAAAPAAARVVEVPHPLADAGTLDEGVQLFERTRAGALLVAGTHRCASLASTPCVGAEATNACAGRLRVSDVAHFAGSYFQRAHETLFRLWPDSAAISLHAHADSAGQPDVIVSAGTRDDVGLAAPVNRLRDGLRGAGFAVASCNTATDPAPRLCGESNVQGRASNGAADACLRDATHTSARFLHVEQGTTVLAAPGALVDALAAQL